MAILAVQLLLASVLVEVKRSEIRVRKRTVLHRKLCCPGGRTALSVV